MRILITGTTGMLGAELLRQSLVDPEITHITALSRKPIAINDTKLKVVIKEDYLDYSDILDEFNDIDACIWCLGISQNAVKSDQEYHTITFDYAINASMAMLSVNPNIKFGFLSGAGAASDEKSRFLFGRVKGKTENHLKMLPFKELFIFRPGYIHPVTARENTPLVEKILGPIFNTFGRFMKSNAISSVDLSIAMIEIMKNGRDQQTFENIDLTKIIDNLNKRK